MVLIPKPQKGVFRNFLKSLRGLSGIGKGTIEDASALLKTANSGIHSVDDALKNLPVTKTRHGFLRMGDETVGRINKLLREGDLGEIARVSKRNISYTSADVKAFKSTVSDTPEKAFKEMSDVVVANKRVYPHLDARVEDIPNLSKSATKDLKTVENNLFKYFKKGTVIALTLGTVYVSADWLVKATEQRKGCFMLTTINNKTTSCKVQAYSCIGQGGHMCHDNLPYYNVTLVLMKIATLDDSDLRKIDVATAAGISPSELNAKLATVIDTKYEAVSKVIKLMTNKPDVDICGIKHPDVENGIVPACRMCSPSDNPISTTFIDPDMYPDNVTFQCSINPSLLDTLTDAAISTGKNLLSGITGGLGPLVKLFAIGFAVILVLLILITVAMKFIEKRRRNTSPTTSSDNTPLLLQSYY